LPKAAVQRAAAHPAGRTDFKEFECDLPARCRKHVGRQRSSHRADARHVAPAGNKECDHNYEQRTGKDESAHSHKAASFCSSLFELFTAMRQLAVAPNPKHWGLRKKQFPSNGTRQRTKYGQANAFRPKQPCAWWRLCAENRNFSFQAFRRQRDAQPNG